MSLCGLKKSHIRQDIQSYGYDLHAYPQNNYCKFLRSDLIEALQWNHDKR